jgi:hypothetical protein
VEGWLRNNLQYAGAAPELAIDMVRLEWAHIEAFDNGASHVLGPEDLLELGPDFRAGLQPYVRLLHLRYPVDELRIRVNADSEDHGTASNAVSMNRDRATRRHAVSAKAEEIYLAVHRVDCVVYYRRLAAEEFRLLQAIDTGASIGEAIDSAFSGSALAPDEISLLLEKWFAVWAALGWLCRPGESPKESNDTAA